MAYDENEDPEDIAEREHRAALIRKLGPSAVTAGWVSFWATVGGFVLFLAASQARPGDGAPVGCLGFVACLVGQIACVITFYRVLRLKLMRAEVSCRKAVVLALPGVLTSLMWAAAMFFLMMRFQRT